MTELPPLACIGVTPTYGNFRDRFVARGIQWFTATRDQYSKFENATVNHAVIYVGPVKGYDPTPQLVEARPGGAGFAPWDQYGDSMIWIDRFKPLGSDTEYVLSDFERQQIVFNAVNFAMNKIGYNYLDFVAIALAQQRFDQLVHYDPKDNPWWLNKAVDRLSRGDRLICSQLDDECYARSGVHLFQDNRPSGLVSPADLLSLKI